jgi:hypothetical protein
MIETPGQYVERVTGSVGYPSEDLRPFSYHTGAPLRPLADDEPCPILFRDVGLEGMSLFLRGQLQRLCGPLSPIVYTRTADYREPYTDHGRIGRLVFLRPMGLRPWHSGVATIYVAPSMRRVDVDAVAFVPAELPLSAAAELAAPMRSHLELREALGGREYDDRLADTLSRVVALTDELRATEQHAAPLRRALQSTDHATREHAIGEMRRLDIGESDLCSAYHHLSAERRAALREALPVVRLPRKPMGEP